MLHEKLDCYQKSLKLAEDIGKDCAKWRRGFGYLHDQVMRAMTSVVLNTSEGNAKRSHADRRRFFEISRASANEASSCVDLMKVFGLTTQEKVIEYKSTLVEISKMLWGLMKV